MVSEACVSRKTSPILDGGKIQVGQIIVFILLITSLLLIRFFSLNLFHITSEIISSVIAFGIFMFAANTYKISNNNFFMHLSIGFIFVGIFDILHTVSYGDINIFINGSYDMTTKFWIAARIIELATFLVAIVNFFNEKKPNFIHITGVYLLVFSFVLLEILYLNITPILKNEGQGHLHLNIVIEYLITSGFFVCILLFNNVKALMDDNTYFYIQSSLIIRMISEMFFTFF